MVGQTVSHYRIGQELGGGGMGVVYLAEDLRLGRTVAIKFLPDAMAGPDSRERFQREARAASSINHPNICTVHDIGDHDGRPFLVMELLEGQTLKHRIASGPVATDDIVEWGIQIADALAAAHERGIVHRDVKPANLFLTSRGQVKVLDFGLAKAMGAPSALSGAGETRTEFHTSIGTTLGTIHYMSPEQARGEDVDARTDLFSFGVVLYEMATGRQPFAGATSAVVFEAILNRTPEAPTQLNHSIPAELDSIVRKAMEKDRRLRYQTASDLLADLTRLKRDSTGDHAPAIVRRTRSSRAVGLAAGAAAALVVGLAAVAWWSRQPNVPAVQPQTEPRVTQVTANPPERGISSAAVSPDGKYLAYSDVRGITLRLLETNDSQLLPDTKGMMVGSWHPDGTRILAMEAPGDFESPAWVVSILGRRQRAAPGRLSPDASMLVHAKKDRIVATRPDGSDSRELIVLGAGESFSCAPVWLRDGRHVAFASSATQASGHETVRVEIVDVSTRSRATVASFKDGHVSGIATLPPNRVVFSGIEHLREGAAFGLWEAYFDGAGAPDVKPPRPILSTDMREIFALSSTADGKRLTYLRASGQLDVLVAEIRSRTMAIGPARRITLDDRNDLPTDWTPDGRVIFTSVRNGTPDIFAQAPDAEDAEVLVGGPGVQNQPRVAPGGRWLVYLSQDGTNIRLMRVPLAGGRPSEVLRPEAYRHHRCGRRERCVLVERHGHEDVVFELDVERGKGRELFRKSSETGDPAVSPDGSRFAFLHTTDPSQTSPVTDPAGPQGAPATVIRVTDISGRTERELPVPGYVVVRGLDWDATGAGLFTAGYTNLNESTLLYVTLDGRIHPLLREPGSMPRWGIPSPDGKHLAIAGAMFDVNVWAADGI